MDKPTIEANVLHISNTPMCDDLGCPSRKNCYRHSASGRVPRPTKQPYFAEPTRAKGDISCPWYWPIVVPEERKPRVRRVTVIEQFTIKNDPSQLKMYLDRTGVANLLGVQPSTISRLQRRKDINFPKPLKLGNKIMHWLRAEVEQFMRRDEMRGAGVRSKKPDIWLGGTPDMPAYPWVWTTNPKESVDAQDQAGGQGEEDQGDEETQAGEQHGAGGSAEGPTDLFGGGDEPDLRDRG